MVNTLFCIFVLFILAGHAAGSDVQTFTDEDLEKYRYPSEKIEPSPAAKPPGEAIDSREPLPAIKGKGQKQKTYEIPYIAFEGTARRIIIYVTFNNSVTVPMVLDTGAPAMHIFDRLAAKLGIFDRDEGKLAEQIALGGQTAWGILTIIDTVQVGGVTDHFVPASVGPPLSDYFDGVIGMDFMANYSIHIDTRRQVVVFDELPQSSAMPGGHDETWWRSTFRKFSSKKAEWQNKRIDLYAQKGNADTLKKLREFADRQYQEAE
jgi:hypothetical protein